VATLADFKKAQDSLVREAQLDINKSVDNTSWEWGYSNDTVQYSICHFKNVGCNGRFTYPINRIDLDSQYCAEMNNMITVHHDTESPLILTQYIYIYIYFISVGGSQRVHCFLHSLHADQQTFVGLSQCIVAFQQICLGAGGRRSG
jgi:hypothetical protein